MKVVKFKDLLDKFDCFFNINNPEDLKKAKNIIDKGWV